MNCEAQMKIIIVTALMAASAMLNCAAAQSTQTDPTTRTIRETGSKNIATQDTTADAAPNKTAGSNKPKAAPKKRQAKQKEAGGNNSDASKASK
jgi:hypothetical protein